MASNLILSIMNGVQFQLMLGIEMNVDEKFMAELKRGIFASLMPRYKDALSDKQESENDD